MHPFPFSIFGLNTLKKSLKTAFIDQKSLFLGQKNQMACHSPNPHSTCLSATIFPFPNIFLLFILYFSSPPRDRYFPSPNIFFLFIIFSSSTPQTKISLLQVFFSFSFIVLLLRLHIFYSFSFSVPFLLPKLNEFICREV